MAARATSPFMEKEYDELDRKIDSFLSTLGAIFRLLVILLVLGGLFFFVFLPNLATWGPVLGFAITVFLVLFVAIVTIIVQVGAVFWYLGRTRVHWIMPRGTSLGLSEFKGNPQLVELAGGLVAMLRGLKGLKESSGQVKRGLLLAGPAGTGKAYLAQCIASEAGVPFAYVSSPSFQHTFPGIGSLKMRMLYRKARKLARKHGACVVFIDEIDALGRTRGRRRGASGRTSGPLGALLMQMDAPPTDRGRKRRRFRLFWWRRNRAAVPTVFTIGATSQPEAVNPALLQPGRLGSTIVVERPSYEGRVELLNFYLDAVRVESDVSVSRIAAEMATTDGRGFTPAEIEQAVSEAVVLAQVDNRDTVTYEDMRGAMAPYQYGQLRQIAGRTPEETRRAAFGAAGRAVATVRLKAGQRPAGLTLTWPDGGASGAAATVDGSGDTARVASKDELLSEIQISLAGRAAEVVLLGTETNAAARDLVRASSHALQYVRSGMNGQLFTLVNESPTLHEREQAESVLQQQFEAARLLIEQNQSHVQAVATALLEKSWLPGEEIEEIVGRIDREIDRTSGRVIDLPTPTAPASAAPAPAATPPMPATVAVRYAGARRPSEERAQAQAEGRMRSDHGTAQPDPSATPPASPPESAADAAPPATEPNTPSS